MKRELDSDASHWVTEVLHRQNRIGERLKNLGFLREGQDDDLSHWLAEVSYAGEILNNKLLPAFFDTEGQAMAVLSVDLTTDLNEMREALEAMQPALVRLMNYLNA